MLVQIHVLRSSPVGSANHGKDGMPKTTYFGGSQRARISSQALKRAIRMDPDFRETLKGTLGERTRTLPALIRAELEKLTEDKITIDAIVEKLMGLGKEAKAKNKGEEEEEEEGDVTEAETTASLIYLAPHEPKDLAEHFLNIYTEWGEKKFEETEIRDLAKSFPAGKPISSDIALFGRMTTSSAFMNVDAATMFAHAISANPERVESDYYTGGDDSSNAAHPVAMIGETGYTSAYFYEYANLHYDTLLNNLGGDKSLALKTAEAFMRAFIFAMPAGKSHGMFNRTPPDLVIIEVSENNSPLTCAGAFESPIRSSEGHSVGDNTIAALIKYMTTIDKMYGLKNQRFILSIKPFEKDAKLPGEEVDTFTGMLEKVTSQLAEKTKSR